MEEFAPALSPLSQMVPEVTKTTATPPTLTPEQQEMMERIKKVVIGVKAERKKRIELRRTQRKRGKSARKKNR